MIRLAQCYTGGVGSEVIRRLPDDPRFELVAVLVHSDDKVGRDAGELVGASPNGVTTTQSLDDVIASKPDAAIWSGLLFDVPAMAQLLEAGIDVYTGIGGYWVGGEEGEAELRAACASGKSSFAAGGNIPGLVSDVFPLFLSGYSWKITQIRAWQRNHVATYPSAQQLQLGLGLGLAPGANEYEEMVDQGWVMGIRQSGKLVAAGLGLEFTECVLTQKDTVTTPVDLTLPTSGLEIPTGTVAGARWTLSCYSGHHEFLRVTNEQTATLGLGPGWREDHLDPAWRVEVDGDPPIVATFGWPGGVDPTTSNVHLNVSRAMNAVPRLVAAPPGCLTVLDYPGVTGFGSVPPG